jgi:hypothetical protein
MKPQEFIRENWDSEEYNDEAGMVKSNLHTIIRSAEELEHLIHDNENMAEWAQEKLAVVKSMIVAVKDYIASEHERHAEKVTGEEGIHEDASSGGTSSGAVATSMGGGDGFGKSIFMSRKGPVKTKKVKK